jgi:hypothetical protein
VNTTMSPRRGPWSRYASRAAITRSDLAARHPSAGRAQCSVGSIDADGMRYGFATSASKTSTNRTARSSVTVQSAAAWNLGGRRCNGLEIIAPEV